MISKTNDVAVQAYKQELNMEEMLKKEEEAREAKAEIDIKKSIEVEKKKAVYLI
jgi:hypothetical protein